jgi:hypothetical protein
LKKFIKFWCDGFWLYFGCAIAAVAVALPIRILMALIPASGQGSIRVGVGLAYAIVLSPVIFSRVFRAMDYSKSRGE